MSTPLELLDAAVHFEFRDGTDCYERVLDCPGGDEGGRVWPSGSVVWEARGCISGESVRWFDTRNEALAAIGKALDGSDSREEAAKTVVSLLRSPLAFTSASFSDAVELAARYELTAIDILNATRKHSKGA